MRRWEDALRIGVDWLAAAPDSAEAHAHQAWALLRCKQQDAESAERHAREAIGLAPEWSWPPRLLAHALGAQDRWEEALAWVGQALQNDPEDDQAHLLAARCLCNLGRTAEALPHAQRAVALDPNDPENRRFLHWLEYLDKSSAADVYNRIHKLQAALALDPTNVNILHDLALIHAQDLADFAAAEALLRQAIEFAPDENLLHEARAELAWTRDQVYRAMRVPLAFVSGLRGTLLQPDDFSPSELMAWGALVLMAVGCCLPASLFAFVPAKAYEWLVLAEHRAPHVGWPWLSRWLLRLGRLPLWVRRAIWAPVPLACAALIVWLVPVPPVASIGGLLILAAGCIAFTAWSGSKARANRRLLSEIVTAESADEIILAEPVEDDIIRAELA